MKSKKNNGAYTSYIGWKNWGVEEFGLVKPGSFFYFNQIFNKKIITKSKILEIGFGNGELLGYFRSKGHEIIGVEIIDDLVDRARNFGCAAYTGPVWNVTDLNSKKFDLIVAFDVAEHMSIPDLNLFISWARNHPNDDGRIYLKFPEGASPFGLANQNSDFTHVSCLTKSKIQAICEASDLQLLSYVDDILYSNKLCTLGFPGKIILRLLQGYASILKWVMKIILFPLATTLRLGTNSIAVIGINSRLLEPIKC